MWSIRFNLSYPLGVHVEEQLQYLKDYIAALNQSVIEDSRRSNHTTYTLVNTFQISAGREMPIPALSIIDLDENFPMIDNGHLSSETL